MGSPAIDEIEAFLRRLGDRYPHPATLYLLDGSAFNPADLRLYLDEVRRQFQPRTTPTTKSARFPSPKLLNCRCQTAVSPPLLFSTIMEEN